MQWLLLSYLTTRNFQAWSLNTCPTGKVACPLTQFEQHGLYNQTGSPPPWIKPKYFLYPRILLKITLTLENGISLMPNKGSAILQEYCT